MKILCLQGLPASGKSSWAKEFCHDNKDWVRVNRDDLRNMKGDYWIPKQENLITKWENSAIESAIEAGFNVIIDATNLNKERNKQRFKDLQSKFSDLKVEYKFFDTSVEECIKRDLKRSDSVGEKVIKGMYYKYLAPPPVVYNEDLNLPCCVIVDIDGTLAKMSGRSPYDWSRVGEDSVNGITADVVRLLYQEYVIIIFTGRDGSCEIETRKWLEDNNIPFNALFMRETGNTEKDAIIKKRLFEEQIRGRYYCKLVIDDRQQVVDMWRGELGLTCFQVDYGDF